jgi:prepilin-type processing-associated H-X9-DG protein
MTPNQKACIFQGQDQPVEHSAVCVGASSFHAGGVNVGFLDGSARYVKNGIDPRVWWAVSTRAGGEVINGF